MVLLKGACCKYKVAGVKTKKTTHEEGALCSHSLSEYYNSVLILVIL